MRRGATLGLWIAAAIMLAVAAVVYFVDPSTSDTDATDAAKRDALETAVARADTYYEFGHYDRAAETYALAVERGMHDGPGWYRYAYARDASGDFSLDTYLAAYRLLLEQAPDHEYLADIESVVGEHSQEFDYEAAGTDALPPGSLVAFTGTISRVRWGRVESGTDTLFVATRSDDWLGHVGDEVRVEAPRTRRYRSGQTLAIVGEYEGWCREDDGAGMTREYPCVAASGVRLLANR